MAKKYEVTTGKRLVSSLLGVAARAGLGNFALLTTMGRTSGLERTVTVGPISDESGEYLVSPYGNSAWVLNLRENPRAKLRRGKQDQVVEMVEVTGNKPELVKAYYEREGFARQFMDVPENPTVDDFAAHADRFPVFRIDPAG